MKIQNVVLFVTIFRAKINKCEHYLKVKLLIFRFYDMGKKTSLQYKLCISLITQAKDTKRMGEEPLRPEIGPF